eukprot:scaffold36545_cov21-Cyclotella_meneghiniana.AAC.1
MELSGYLEEDSELEWVGLVRQVEATKANVMFCDGLAEVKIKVDKSQRLGRRDGVGSNNSSEDIDKNGDNGEDEDNRSDCKYGKRAEGWKECEEPGCS